MSCKCLLIGVALDIVQTCIQRVFVHPPSTKKTGSTWVCSKIGDVLKIPRKKGSLDRSIHRARESSLKYTPQMVRFTFWGGGTFGYCRNIHEKHFTRQEPYRESETRGPATTDPSFRRLCCGWWMDPAKSSCRNLALRGVVQGFQLPGGSLEEGETLLLFPILHALLRPSAGGGYLPSSGGAWNFQDCQWSCWWQIVNKAM